jgi:hypothetical protein
MLEAVGGKRQPLKKLNRQNELNRREEVEETIVGHA